MRNLDLLPTREGLAQANGNNRHQASGCLVAAELYRCDYIVATILSNEKSIYLCAESDRRTTIVLP